MVLGCLPGFRNHERFSPYRKSFCSWLFRPSEIKRKAFSFRVARLSGGFQFFDVSFLIGWLTLRKVYSWLFVPLSFSGSLVCSKAFTVMKSVIYSTRNIFSLMAEKNNCLHRSGLTAPLFLGFRFSIFLAFRRSP